MASGWLCNVQYAHIWPPFAIAVTSFLAKQWVRFSIHSSPHCHHDKCECQWIFNRVRLLFRYEFMLPSTTEAHQHKCKCTICRNTKSKQKISKNTERPDCLPMWISCLVWNYTPIFAVSPFVWNPFGDIWEDLNVWLCSNALCDLLPMICSGNSLVLQINISQMRNYLLSLSIGIKSNSKNIFDILNVGQVITWQRNANETGNINHHKLMNIYKNRSVQTWNLKIDHAHNFAYATNVRVTKIVLIWHFQTKQKIQCPHFWISSFGF